MYWTIYICMTTILLLLERCTCQLIDVAVPTIVTANKQYSVNSPTWVTSPFFRAGNQAVINSYTGSGQQPSYTFTFSSALPGLPNLAYGLKGYRGNDYLGQQYWQVTRIGLTASTFSVRCEIFGVTNLWVMEVAYLAIDPTFPHHLNAFDNVPLNYSSGAIQNISIKSSTETKYHVQTINYTQQTAGRTFTSFTNPLEYNRIVLFITNLWIAASFYAGPVQFHIQPTVLTQTFYQWNATLRTNVMITNVKFSQIIFNSDDVEKSKKYFIVYQYWINSNQASYVDVIPEFVDNFIMALTDFQTTDGSCGFEYVWNWHQNSTHFGISLDQSITIKNRCGFSWSRSTIVYMMTWTCLAPFNYFNLTTGECQTLCGGFFYENTTENTCDQCQNQACYQCQEVTDRSQCTDCATHFNFQIVGTTCVCLPNHYEAEDVCYPCDNAMAHCLDCSYDDLNNGTLAFDSSIFICLQCNQTANNFLQNDKCIQCTLSNCITCDNLTHCQICQDTYSFSSISTCIKCYVTGCLYCSMSNGNICDTCNATAGYYQDGNKCKSICGDGIVVLADQECDDGGNVYYDGCDGVCLVEDYFGCQGLRSVCKFNVNVTMDITAVESSVSSIPLHCNMIDLTFKLTPQSLTFNQAYINWTNFVSILNITHIHPNYTLTSYSNFNYKIQITIKETIENQTMFFDGNIQHLIANSTIFSEVEVVTLGKLIKNTNGVQAVFQCCQGYYQDIDTLECIQICGDGRLYELQCDDGNILGSDGCSPNCTIDEDYDCINGTTTSPSICNYNGTLNINILSAYKDPHQNQLNLIYTSDPIQQLLDFVDNDTNFITVISFPGNPQINVISAFYDPYYNQIVVKINYTQTIQSKQIIMAIQPPTRSNGATFMVSQNGWIVEPTNRLAAEYYQDGVYEQVYFFDNVTQGLGYSFSGIAAVGAVLSKSISLEMATVVQVGYLSVIQNDRIPPLMHSLTQMKPFGYNSFYLTEYPQDQPQNETKDTSTRRLESIEGSNTQKKLSTSYQLYNFKKYFGFNINLMFFIYFAIVIIGLLCMSISYCMKKSKSRKMKNIGLYLITELAYGIYVFLLPAMVISVGIEAQEGTIMESGVYWSQILLILGCFFLVMNLAMAYFVDDQSGEVSIYFRKHSQFGVKAALIHALRVLAISIFMFTYQTIPSVSMYAMLAVQLLYTVLVTFGQPHKKAFDNIRSIVAEFLLLYILAMRFAMTFILVDVYTDYSNDFYTITAYIEYSIYALIILSALIALVYHFLRRCCSAKNKVENADITLDQLRVINKKNDSMAKLDDHSPSKRNLKQEQQKHNAVVYNFDDDFSDGQTGNTKGSFESINLDPYNSRDRSRDKPRERKRIGKRR